MFQSFQLTCNPQGERNHSQSWDNRCFQDPAWKACSEGFKGITRQSGCILLQRQWAIIFSQDKMATMVSSQSMFHLGQPLARASRVEWGIGGLYLTVKDWRRGQWSATSPITAAASSLAVMLNVDSWLHLEGIHICSCAIIFHIEKYSSIQR